MILRAETNRLIGLTFSHLSGGLPDFGNIAEALLMVVNCQFEKILEPFPKVVLFIYA